jgi:RNA polymerase sigma-70 factor (ECF subfamily)
MDHEQKKEQFLAIYDTHSDAIFRFCALKVSTREVAQDITQDVFMRYWQSLRKNDEIKNDRAFLYTMARNLVIDWYRKKKESSLDVMTDAGIDFSGADRGSVTQQAEMKEVLRLIGQLDPDSRDVLLMRYMEGLSPKDIAMALNETPNVISVRLHRAVKKVQDLIHASETHD